MVGPDSCHTCPCPSPAHRRATQSLSERCAASIRSHTKRRGDERRLNSRTKFRIPRFSPSDPDAPTTSKPRKAIYQTFFWMECAVGLYDQAFRIEVAGKVVIADAMFPLWCARIYSASCVADPGAIVILNASDPSDILYMPSADVLHESSALRSERKIRAVGAIISCHGAESVRRQRDLHHTGTKGVRRICAKPMIMKE
ncbi:hypothetical protein K474DRAFT_716333 [Panus rudis PR-1116 ss-1]|nr:hypothetical protein K474DRAFT_716333 [Panus rudis PR-1116 ss-1]